MLLSLCENESETWREKCLYLAGLLHVSDPWGGGLQLWSCTCQTDILKFIDKSDSAANQDS